MNYYKAYRFKNFIIYTNELTDSELNDFERGNSKFLRTEDEENSIRESNEIFFLYEWKEYSLLGNNSSNLSYEDYYYSGKYTRHNTGIFQVKNFIGIVKFKDQIFQVESKKMDTLELNELLMEIDLRIQETISLTFSSKGISRGTFKKNRNSFHNYYIYKKIYNSLKNDKILPYAKYIQDNPAYSFATNVSNEPISIISNISTDSLIDITEGKNLLVRSKKASKLSRRFKGYIPIEMNEYNSVINIDTSENQFVKYFLQYIAKILSQYIEDLNSTFNSKEEMSKNKLLVDELSDFRESILKELNSSFFKEISKLNSVNRASTILTKKYGYHQLYSEFVNLKQSPFNCFNTNSLIELYENRSIDKLYEYISLFRMIDILDQIYDSENDLSKVELTNKKYTVSISEENEAVQFIFEGNEKFPKSILLYQHYFSKNRTFSKSVSVDFKPDLTLKIEDSLGYEYYHFDSKFRIDYDETSKNDDIAKMHSYRDAIKKTRGAFVLFPGERHTLFSISDKLEDKYEGVGAFPLNINISNDDYLTDMVETVLKRFKNR